MATAYNYNKNTGIYVSEVEVLPDAFGDINLSAYQTTDSPHDCEDHECCRYLDENGDVPTHHGVNNAAWVIHADYIGTVHYDPDGTMHTITELNETVPIGNITTPPTSIYHTTHNGSEWNYTENSQHIEDRCDEVDVLYLEKISDDFTYNTYGWQVSKESQRDINDRTLYATLSDIDNTTFPWSGNYVSWLDSSNTARSFATASDYKDFAKAVMDHCEGLKQQAITHKANLRSGSYSTYTAVNDYDITSGW